jgi:hypothetical protein
MVLHGKFFSTPGQVLRADPYGLRTMLRQTLSKAQAAYDDSVQADLAKVIEDLRLRPYRRDQCMSVMRRPRYPRPCCGRGSGRSYVDGHP